MRTVTAFICVVGLLAVAPRASAQEWVAYTSERDAFEAQFPPDSQPTVTEVIWESQSGFKLPSRIYSVVRGPRSYTVTVADYTGIQELGKARIKTCKSDDEICVGSNLSGEGFWKHDTRGAKLYAVSKVLTRPDVRVTDIAWNQIGRVSTILVSLANNKDESKTYALVTMYEMMLYIVESTVPREAPSPVQFAGSFGLHMRGTGKPPFYSTLYVHEIHALREAPVPPLAGPGQQGPTLYKRE
jgi:hypothetical protein